MCLVSTQQGRTEREAHDSMREPKELQSADKLRRQRHNSGAGIRLNFMQDSLERLQLAAQSVAQVHWLGLRRLPPTAMSSRPNFCGHIEPCVGGAVSQELQHGHTKLRFL